MENYTLNNNDELIKELEMYYSEENEKAFTLALQILKENPKCGYAYFVIGACYNRGIGTEIDNNKSMDYILKSVELNDADGQYYYATYLRYMKNPECIEWFEKAVENGMPSVCDILGNIYEEGELVPRNIKKAIACYEEGVKRGFDYCLLSLGDLYVNENFEWINKKLALYYYFEFQKACSDEISGYEGVARCYEYGIGTEKNLDMAIHQYRKAIGLKNADAEFYYNFAKCLEKNHDGECIVWYQKAINEESEISAKAAYELGKLYLESDFMQKNDVLGMKFLNKAVELGDGNKYSLEAKICINKHF